ncbi:MAG: SGNH/GDSL hydrolase family protein [Actinomycetota bacterium]
MRRWWMRTVTAGLVLVLVAASCSGDDDGGAAPDPDAALTLESDVVEGDGLDTTTTTLPPTTTTTEPPEPLRWLAVGDSYSSGEGLDDAVGDCSRSPRAYPALAAALLTEAEVAGFASTACTAAHSDDWPDQWAASTLEEPNLITATFGGNDVGFVDLMIDCLGLDDSMELLSDAGDLSPGELAEAFLSRGCDRTEAEIDEDLAALQPLLEELYADMAEVVGPEGDVVILGYPAPVADPDTWPGSRCDGISADDGRLLRRAADRLNATIEAATDTRANVHFVDVAPSFEGHGRCGAEPWLYGPGDLLQRVEDEDGSRLTIAARPFHPTAEGHEAMALVVASSVDTIVTSS